MLTQRHPGVLPDEDFLAGLLHAVGTLYMLSRARDHLDVFTERAAFATIVANWNARIGERITAACEFPPELVAAVGGHASCGLGTGTAPSLTELVAIANFLALRIESGDAECAILDDAPDLGALIPDRSTLSWMVTVSANEVRIPQEALEI